MAKVCTKCKKLKEHDEFKKDIRRSDGRVSRCKSCIKQAQDILNERQKKRREESWGMIF
jgi:bacterioferritin-associated ferredoxin